MQSPLLRIEDLTKSYANLAVLREVSCTVNRGDVVSIIGPSGSGKSTLLRCVSLLEPVDSGRMYLDGDEIGFTIDVGGQRKPVSNSRMSSVRRRVGMVFQNFNLFPHKTILENVTEGPRIVLRRPRAECEAEAEHLLKRVGILDKRNEYPSRLSGGQQQRAAIARALAMKPQLMLFDEPTSSLDPELKGEVLDAIRDLCSSGMTSLIVTHEINFAREISNRILMFDGGRIVEEGDAQKLFESPQNPRTRDFLRKVR